MGSAIRRLRLAKGLTLREISKASAISLPYLSEIERGRKEPSSEILQTVCVVLGITLRQLMRETDVELVAADRAAGVAPVLDLTARRHAASTPSSVERMPRPGMSTHQTVSRGAGAHPVATGGSGTRAAGEAELLIA
jgi:transcriptional regulator with XRE-family HTH domain